ncbi:hypothetical protein OAN21_01710 [Alphaproteobacteria bacterium]|jgi:hypothetical protein|nr:hypothetical protein [Alphaproteobacteria bacterium]
MKKVLVQNYHHKTFFPASRKRQERIISSFEDALYSLVIKYKKGCTNSEVSELKLHDLSRKVRDALDRYYFDDDLRSYLISLKLFISSCEVSGLNLAKSFFYIKDTKDQ